MHDTQIPEKVALPGDAEAEEAVRAAYDLTEKVGSIAFRLKRLDQLDFEEGLELVERVRTLEDIGRLYVLAEDLRARLVEVTGYVEDIEKALETLDILRVEAKRMAA